MSASMSISSNRVRTDLSPCFRCLRYRRIRTAPGEGEREGGRLLIVLLDAALHLVYEACGRLARLGSSRSWSPRGRTVPRFHLGPQGCNCQLHIRRSCRPILTGSRSYSPDYIRLCGHWPCAALPFAAPLLHKSGPNQPYPFVAQVRLHSSFLNEGTDLCKLIARKEAGHSPMATEGRG
jgi:hypothetical protein